MIVVCDSATSHTDPTFMVPAAWVGGVTASHTQSQLAPSDSVSLGPSNVHHLLGQQFVIDDVIVALTAWLQALDQDSFAKGFKALVFRSDKCLKRGGV
jgi:hypothetical protein